MKIMAGVIANSLLSGEISHYVNKPISIKGLVYRIRKIGGIKFVIIRENQKFIQCVIESENTRISEEVCREGNHVIINGIVKEEPRSPGGVEVNMQSCTLLSAAAKSPPFTINKKNLDIDLSTNLDFRPISLRHQKQAAIFRVQATLAQLFREALQKAGFTEIFSPKLVFAGAEGGANIFEVKYFKQKMFLAQSPQFYKQMMVGVFGRVFEIAPVFRAEPHDTSRHLNEYISMDFEMGYIDNFEDIMQMETYILKYIFEHLPKVCETELSMLQAKIPILESIPAITFAEAKNIASKNHVSGDDDDLDAVSEQLICKHIANETGSELVFVTHYPSTKRPVYAMEDSTNHDVTLSFDLLMRGLEITTGGQRIHNYDEQIAKMIRRGLNPDEFTSYLMIHKYGMPPHGGLGMGLERLTMQLLNLSSAKEASLFPRTINRVTP